MDPAPRKELAEAAPGRERPPGCERFWARLQDALDDRAPLDALKGEPHLVACPGCRAELDAFGALDRLLASEPAAEPPGDLAASVLARLGAENARARWRARVSALLGAAAVVALGVGIELWGSSLRSGASALLEDALGLARVATARVDALDQLPSLEIPALPTLPGATGSLATLALTGALGLAAGEVVWWRRARRAGGAA